MIEQFRNPGSNTYNGVKMLASLTGLTEAEIAWVASRLKELMGAGVPKDEARRMVREEAKNRPWEGTEK